MKLFLIGIFFFGFNIAHAELNLKQVAELNSFLAQKMNQRPISDSFLQSISMKLSDYDRMHLPKMMKEWDKRSDKVNVGAQLDYLVIYVDKYPLFSLHVIQQDPLVIQVNDNDKIQIDKSNVIQSVSKFFQNVKDKKKTSAFWRNIEPIAYLLTKTAEASAENPTVYDLAGVKPATLLFVAGQLSPLDNDRLLDSEVKKNEGAENTWLEAIRQRDFGPTTMTCRANQISGKTKIKGEEFKFELKNDELSLSTDSGKSYKVKLVETTVEKALVQKTVKDSYKIDDYPLLKSIAALIPEADYKAWAERQFSQGKRYQYPYDEVDNYLRWKLEKKDDSIQFKALTPRVQVCTKDNCHVIADEAPGYEGSLSDFAELTKTRIESLKNKFAEKHGIAPDVVYEDGQWLFSPEPPTMADGASLVEYKRKLISLKVDVTGKTDELADAKMALAETVVRLRALRTCCSDSNCRELIAKKGLNLKPAPEGVR